MKSIVNLTPELISLKQRQNGVEQLQGYYREYLLEKFAFINSQPENFASKSVLEAMAGRIASLACGCNRKRKKYDAAIISKTSSFSVKYLEGALRAEGVDVLYA